MVRTTAPGLFVGSLGLCALLTACSGQGSSGNSSGDGGSDSGGGSQPDGGGATCSPEAAFTGAPLSGPAGQWQWVPVDGAKCRNGSSTGFGVRLNPSSNRVFIFFEGGGACFNYATCSNNPDHFAAADFMTWQTASGSVGIFDSSNAANPVGDWNAVYIPYCTGDVHAGAATGVNVPPGIITPSNQSFVVLSA